MLTVVGYAKLQVVVDACSNEPRGPPITTQEHGHAVILQQALHHIPNHTTEFTTRNVAIRLGQQLAEQVLCLMYHLHFRFKQISVYTSRDNLHTSEKLV